MQEEIRMQTKVWIIIIFSGREPNFVTLKNDYALASQLKDEEFFRENEN